MENNNIDNIDQPIVIQSIWITIVGCNAKHYQESSIDPYILEASLVYFCTIFTHYICGKDERNALYARQNNP